MSRGPCPSESRQSSVLLAALPLTVELLPHNPQCSEEVAEEEEEEGEATHEHLGKKQGEDWLSRSQSPHPFPRASLTCHSLHSGSRARLNKVSALKSCQNWEEVEIR